MGRHARGVKVYDVYVKDLNGKIIERWGPKQAKSADKYRNLLLKENRCEGFTVTIEERMEL